jgi:hypothetical protein
MGRSRPLLWLLAALIAFAVPTFAAGCGDEEDKPEESPKTLLGTAAAKKIDSAEVRLRADANIPNFPILGSRLVLTGSGPIVMNGPDALATFDSKVALRAGGQTFPARVFAVDGRVFVFFMGLYYEAEPELLEQLGISTEPGSPAPVSLRQMGIDPSGWLRNVKVTDGDEIGGDSTRLVTGRVNEQAVIDDLLAVVDADEIRKRLEEAGQDIGGLPEIDEQSADRVAKAVEDVDVEVNVDDEGYPRRVYAKLRFTVPKDVENAAYDGGTVTFELVFDQVGDVEVDVQPPPDAKPLSSLFKFAGVIFGVDELSDLWTVPN